MKVLLVHAAGRFPHFEKAYPLGLLYLASSLSRTGRHEASVEDMQIGDGSMSAVLARIRRDRPDVVGIGSMTLHSPAMHRLAAGIKSENPGLPIIAGGAHAANYPEEILADANIDFVATGESEKSFPRLLNAVESGSGFDEATNCVFRRTGSLIRTSAEPLIDDLDSLPPPDYGLLPAEKYFDAPRIGFVYARRRYATLITSRGCPFGCIFCHQIHGRRVRRHGLPYILDHMESLIRDHGIEEFVIVDDYFNSTKERTKEFAKAIIDRRLTIALSFPSGLRGDSLDEETFALLKKAGTWRCMIAFETGSARMQKEIGKNLAIDKATEAVNAAARHGILVNGSFMLGFPKETYEEMKATARLAIRSNLHSAAFLRVIAFKNTELYNLAVAQGVAIPTDFGDYNFLSTKVNLTEVPERKIRRLKRWAYFRFYSSPKRLLRIARLLPNKREQVPRIAAFLFRKAFLW